MFDTDDRQSAHEDARTDGTESPPEDSEGRTSREDSESSSGKKPPPNSASHDEEASDAERAEQSLWDYLKGKISKEDLESVLRGILSTNVRGLELTFNAVDSVLTKHYEHDKVAYERAMDEYSQTRQTLAGLLTCDGLNEDHKTEIVKMLARLMDQAHTINIVGIKNRTKITMAALGVIGAIVVVFGKVLMAFFGGRGGPGGPSTAA